MTIYKTEDNEKDPISLDDSFDANDLGILSAGDMIYFTNTPLATYKELEREPMTRSEGTFSYLKWTELSEEDQQKFIQKDNILVSKETLRSIKGPILNALPWQQSAFKAPEAQSGEGQDIYVLPDGIEETTPTLNYGNQTFHPLSISCTAHFLSSDYPDPDENDWQDLNELLKNPEERESFIKEIQEEFGQPNAEEYQRRVDLIHTRLHDHATALIEALPQPPSISNRPAALSHSEPDSDPSSAPDSPRPQ